MLCRMAVNSEAGLASTALLIEKHHLGQLAANTGPSCSQLQTGRSTPGAHRPSSQQTAAGFKPRTFSTCMPQAGALTN